MGYGLIATGWYCGVKKCYLEPIKGLECTNGVREAPGKLKKIDLKFWHENQRFDLLSTCLEDPINPDKERSTSSRPSR